MSAFTAPLTITELDGRKGLWRVERELPYEEGHEGSGRWIIVPTGWPTDGATTMWFRWLYAAWGPWSRAAALHDHLCDLIKAGTPHPLAPTYAEAARIFRQAAKVGGTSLVDRWVMWAGIRLWFAVQGKA